MSLIDSWLVGSGCKFKYKNEQHALKSKSTIRELNDVNGIMVNLWSVSSIRYIFLGSGTKCELSNRVEFPTLCVCVVAMVAIRAAAAAVIAINETIELTT